MNLEQQADLYLENAVTCKFVLPSTGYPTGCMREHSDMTFISLISDGCVKISQTSLRNEFPVKDEEAWQRLEKSKPDVTATC